MNAHPDWQDGECCFRCRTQFTLVARKHHCRNCGNIFCAKCSSRQIPLPKLNLDKNVRVCDTCYDVELALGPKDSAPSNEQKPKPKSSSSIKSGASASAPSEQELKEEEEFQLALALSLSETPTKVSFPDYRHLEQPQSSALPTKTLEVPTNNIQTPITSNDTPLPETSAIQEYFVQDRDQELFKYIGEVHGTLEVFNNRLEACKLRNRPISNDAAIQSLFIRLNSEVQPKLSDYIKAHEDERSIYERLQDKLSQIADARAALNDLREEHQEKLRQIAVEAEKQRQSQLAAKLEAMRQKKTQLMQYQRELAMQRIREQEQIYRQQQPQQQQVVSDYQAQPIVSSQLPYQQPLTEQQSYNPYTAPQQQQAQVVGLAPQQPSIDRAAIAELEKQFLPDAKPDEEAPLISFDD